MPCTLQSSSHPAFFNAWAHVSGFVEVDRTIEAVLTGLSDGREVQFCKAFGRRRKAGDRFKQAQVKIARDPRMPVELLVIVELTGDLERVVYAVAAVRGQAQAAQVGCISGEVDSGLHESMHGLDFGLGNGAREIEISGAEFDTTSSPDECGNAAM